MRNLALTTFFLAASLAPALAQELAVVGAHPLRGQRDGVAFEGSLEISADASFRAERRFADGRVTTERGLASLGERALVLSRARGIRGALAGEEPGEVLRFVRDRGAKERVLFRAAADGARETLDLGPTESRWDHIRRSLRDGKEWRYVFFHNRGLVDEAADGLWIQRSRQPRPRDLVRFARDGGRTVLSLNGDQDKEGTHWVRDEDDPDETVPVRVNIRDFIREQGLEHHWVGLSSKRAPSDAELVAIFRVLLDDSKKPIYLHCTGGADRTGVIAALYQIEFLGVSKEAAKEDMRRHMWTAYNGTEIQGAVIDLYQPGTIRRLLREAGVEIPPRYR